MKYHKQKKTRATTHKRTCREGQDFLQEAKYRINQYNKREFGNEDTEDFKDLTNIGLAYTTYYVVDSYTPDDYKNYPVTDKEFDSPWDLQVSLNLETRTLTTSLNDVVLRSVTYSEADLLKELAYMDFDSLVEDMWNFTGEEVLRAIRKEKAA